MFTDNNSYGNSLYYCVCSVCSCVSEGQKQTLALGVFLSHSPPYLFRQGLLLNLGLPDSDGLAAHRAPEPQDLLLWLSSSGITGMAAVPSFMVWFLFVDFPLGWLVWLIT